MCQSRLPAHPELCLGTDLNSAGTVESVVSSELTAIRECEDELMHGEYITEGGLKCVAKVL